MDKIIELPFIISAALLISREPRDVFILVFLPVLTTSLVRQHRCQLDRCRRKKYGL